MVQLLPHLKVVCRRAREDAGVGYAKVAGEAGFSASTSISRTFEGTGDAWPKNPDLVVGAYAKTTGVSVFDLWDAAVKLAREEAPTLQELAEGALADANAADQSTRRVSGKSPSSRRPTAKKRQAG